MTVDQVASIARIDRLDVLKAIDSKRLLASQERGEWRIEVEDMRRWLSHR
jgi:hypothetical protein